MNRALTFAAGAALTWIAWRSRPGVLRIPIGIAGVRMLARSLRRDEPLDHDRDESHAVAPGTELPAWW